MQAKRYEISFFVSETDYQYLKHLLGETDISVNTMVKHIVLQKKTVLLTRNHSMDELLEELILLRKQLPPEYKGLDRDTIALFSQINSLIQKLAIVWLQ